ncbi:MAG: ATP-binding protein [Kiloniellales bacterium]
MALWPVAAAAADGGPSGGWLVAAAGGVVVALAAAIWVHLGRRIAKLSRQGAAASARARHLSDLLDQAVEGCWLWPVDRPGRQAGPPRGPGGRLSPALAEALGLAPDAGWEQLCHRLPEASRRQLDPAFAALRAEGTRFDLTLEMPDGGSGLGLSGRRVASAGGTTDIVWVHNLTASSKALAEAREAAEQRDGFKALLDALPLPVWRRRTDLDLEWCNAAYAQALGGDPASVAESGLELAAGAIDHEGRGLAERARDTRVSQSESHPVVVNGARRLFDFTELPLKDENGEVAGLVGYAQDCTGLEETQHELARHIAAHGEVLERLGSAIAIFGSDTRLKFFNHAYVQLWGLDQQWLAGEPTLGEVLEALRERRRLPEFVDFQAFKQEQLNLFTSLIEPMEELFYRPDDTTIRQVLSPHPFGGLIFTFEDVTDRLALERSYDTLSAVQQETINNLHDGVAVFGSDGRLQLSNPAFARLWDLTPEDLAEAPHISVLIEKTKRFFTLGEDWSTLKPRIISRVTEPESRAGRLERTDGMVLSYACVPLPDGACLLSYIDVTDSIRVERALRERTEALETADRLKSEFIANVSYELRTPLTVILGFTEILANKYFGPLNDRQMEYIRGILESSQRLLALINDILDLAIIEAGHMRLDLAPVDVHQLLTAVVELSESRARQVDLKLDLDCPADIGMLIADERRLKQAIFNLVSNAIKFTPPDGRVTVSGRRAATGAAEEVVIEVADTGTGISEADQEQVFEAFHRVDPEARASGPGLGLSLVKSFVELHSGKVEFISRPGGGTQVLCTLPARPQQRDGAPESAPAADTKAAGETAAH